MDENRKLLRNFEKILKIFDENSIEKLNFYFIFILENLLLKIEPSEITPFFGFGGGGFPFTTLWLRHCHSPLPYLSLRAIYVDNSIPFGKADDAKLLLQIIKTNAIFYLTKGKDQ